MKIATWNVNSVKARLPNILSWLKEAKPDIVCLQEIKCITEAFPSEAFGELGYNIAAFGQKTYNGVAILSRLPLEDIKTGLYSEDEQARYIEALISVKGGVIRIASIYLPNGNPVPGEKYEYKLRFMAKLEEHIKELLSYEEPLILAGDYNVIPEDEDCYDSALWTEDALFLPETRAAFRRIIHLGLHDAFRACNSSAEQYSWWDYRGGNWEKNHGARIDHLLLSSQALDKLENCWIDTEPRGKEKPSDHTPVLIQISA